MILVNGLVWELSQPFFFNKYTRILSSFHFLEIFRNSGLGGYAVPFNVYLLNLLWEFGVTF
jgi:hypothetical protein